MVLILLSKCSYRQRGGCNPLPGSSPAPNSTSSSTPILSPLSSSTPILSPLLISITIEFFCLLDILHFYSTLHLLSVKIDWPYDYTVKQEVDAAHTHTHTNTHTRAANRPYFSVFSQKIAPLSALRKSTRIVWIFKNCQVTAKKYTYRTAHARTCTAHELQNFMYCAGNSMVCENAAKYIKTLPGYAKRKPEVGSSDTHTHTLATIASKFFFCLVLFLLFTGYVVLLLVMVEMDHIYMFRAF